MEFTHINKDGFSKMVEISDKKDTKRIASAKAIVIMKQSTLVLIKEGLIKKGAVLNTAQIGGIMGAKNTSNIIPMCHNIPLTGVDLNFIFIENGIEIISIVNTVGKTGVEMEALTAVSIAALTIYDMCKSVDKDITIENICLLTKSGGKSGEYIKIK